MSGIHAAIRRPGVILTAIFLSASAVSLAIQTPPTGLRRNEQSVNPVAPPRSEPISAGANVMSSKLIHRVIPAYPEAARIRGISGTVLLVATINETGQVYETRLVTGHPLLERTAIAAVKQWRYSPSLINYEPIAVRCIVRINVAPTGDEWRLALDDRGELKEPITGLTERALSDRLQRSNKPILITHSPKVTVRIMERAFRRLERRGVRNLQMGGYLSWNDRLFCLGGAGIEEPKTSLDRERLMRIAAESGLLPEASSMQRPLTYWLLISETGKVLGVDRLRGPRIAAVEDELMRTRVLSPASDGSVSLPFAVYVELEYTL